MKRRFGRPRRRRVQTSIPVKTCQKTGSQFQISVPQTANSIDKLPINGFPPGPARSCAWLSRSCPSVSPGTPESPLPRGTGGHRSFQTQTKPFTSLDVFLFLQCARNSPKLTGSILKPRKVYAELQKSGRTRIDIGCKAVVMWSRTLQTQVRQGYYA